MKFELHMISTVLPHMSRDIDMRKLSSGEQELLLALLSKACEPSNPDADRSYMAALTRPRPRLV